jgi:hypothetical protein
MAFDNRIRKTQPGSVEFDCSGGIEIGRFQITRVLRFTCPLKTKDITGTDSWTYIDGIFEPDDPGRYIVEYVPI